MMNAPFNERVFLLRKLMISRGIDTVVLRKNPNLAWLIGGRVHVPLTLDLGCFDLVVTHSQVRAITNVIEGPRLIAEEFPEGITVEEIPWWKGRDPLLPRGEKIGADSPGPGWEDLNVDIEILRSALTKSDQERLREVSRDSAVALGGVMREISNTDREVDVAGRISMALWQKNLELVFIGVAGDARVRRFRHALPTVELIGTRAVASISARRKGLIASVTRIVSFGQVSPLAENEYVQLLNVERAMLDATAVDSPFSRPIQAAVSAYPAFGFDQDEWHHHHQGGPTGYLPRDWPANLDSTRAIAEGQPFSWNPTAAGWKVEDTWLAQRSGPEMLSADASWPATEVGGRRRPDILRR